jgi:Domain of unknown function (DUF4406)
MTTLRIYIAGPMTGKKDYNYPAFNKEAELLRGYGHTVINPAEINNVNTPWHECIRKNIVELVSCNALQLLPGWHDSRGAKLEYYIAESLGMLIYMPVEI